jgi:hypothetical protein
LHWCNKTENQKKKEIPVRKIQPCKQKTKTSTHLFKKKAKRKQSRLPFESKKNKKKKQVMPHHFGVWPGIFGTFAVVGLILSIISVILTRRKEYVRVKPDMPRDASANAAYAADGTPGPPGPPGPPYPVIPPQIITVQGLVSPVAQTTTLRYELSSDNGSQSFEVDDKGRMICKVPGRYTIYLQFVASTGYRNSSMSVALLQEKIIPPPPISGDFSLLPAPRQGVPLCQTTMVLGFDGVGGFDKVSNQTSCVLECAKDDIVYYDCRLDGSTELIRIWATCTIFPSLAMN